MFALQFSFGPDVYS